MIKWLIYFLFFIEGSVYGQVITTIAGNGTYGYSGDGGQATLAQMARPLGIALNNVTNSIYIADHDNNVIRKVNSAGIISSVVGTGVLGYSGDGGNATAANLYHPTFVSTDAFGNIYFADQNGSFIRKVSTNGIITTIAASLTDGYSGDGGPLIGAKFRSIRGISFDNAGNMYIADGGNHVIRKVDAAGIITTVVGNGTLGFSGDGGSAINAQLNYPYAVSFDNLGNMYIPDNGNRRIRKVTSTGIISTYAGNGALANAGDGGPAVFASFKIPYIVEVDYANNVYVGDADHVVRKINTLGIISSFAGNGTYGYTGDGGSAANALLGEVSGVRADLSGNVYILVRNYFQVLRKVSNCLTASITLQPTNVSLCNTGNASFSVNATNATNYQWQVNTGSAWANVGNNVIYNGVTSNSLTVTNANVSMNGYQYRCAVTNGCATIYSSIATLIVSTPIITSISVATPNATICSGSNAVFTATTVNGGTSPFYQWFKNGIPVGTNSNIYSSNLLSNGDIIKCELITNNACSSSNTVTSNVIQVTVNSILAPSIIANSSTNNICSGTPVSFNAQIVNGGSNPNFQWQNNAVNVGTNSPTLTTNTLNNGDIITCILTSNESCVLSSIVTSNPITITVNNLVAPAVIIVASTTVICPGVPITFTSTVINGGSSPQYQWRVNNQNASSNNATFISTSLQNGDVVSCSITSNSSSCLTSTSAVSNNIAVTKTPDPSVAIAANTTGICISSPVQFTAIPSNAGALPIYEWYVNNTILASSSNNLFSINTLLNNDIVSCRMVTNNGCNYTIESNSIQVAVDKPPTIGFIPDTVIYNGVGLKLYPIVSGNNINSYKWSPSTDLNFSNIINPLVTLTNTSRTYKITVTTKNGCSNDAEVTVRVIDIIIPNAFSPNSDGVNDNWKIIGIPSSNCKVEVFNRMGMIIFRSLGYTIPWDGTFQNKPVPSGAYYYLIEDKESRKRYSGWIVVLR